MMYSVSTAHEKPRFTVGRMFLRLHSHKGAWFGVSALSILRLRRIMREYGGEVELSWLAQDRYEEELERSYES